MRIKSTQPVERFPVEGAARGDGERGFALILALMVALILAFLGLGLLLQTSLGLQASGADRWVVKSLNAADAGVMMEIELIQSGYVVDPNTLPGANNNRFMLQDDPSLPGLLRGEYEVRITRLCEVQPATPILGWEEQFRQRYLHVESRATRSIGALVGTTGAQVKADVTIWPFDMSTVTPLTRCY